MDPPLSTCVPDRQIEKGSIQVYVLPSFLIIALGAQESENPKENPIRINGDYLPSEFSSYRATCTTHGSSRFAYVTQNNSNMTRGLYLSSAINNAFSHPTCQAVGAAVRRIKRKYLQIISLRPRENGWGETTALLCMIVRFPWAAMSSQLYLPAGEGTSHGYRRHEMRQLHWKHRGHSNDHLELILETTRSPPKCH